MKRSRIMYIENKSKALREPARIGRVELSPSDGSADYRGRCLRRVYGFRANYQDLETGDMYWLSPCKESGLDRLYPGAIEIDGDVREEYWTQIRHQPENRHLTTIPSEDKPPTS